MVWWLLVTDYLFLVSRIECMLLYVWIYDSFLGASKRHSSRCTEPRGCAAPPHSPRSAKQSLSGKVHAHMDDTSSIRHQRHMIDTSSPSYDRYAAARRRQERLPGRDGAWESGRPPRVSVHEWAGMVCMVAPTATTQHRALSECLKRLYLQ